MTNVRLSADAEKYMRDLAELYEKAGLPNHKVWGFDGGKDGPPYNELSALQLLELSGTRGSSWRMTNQGHQVILQIRTARLAREAEDPNLAAARRVFGEFREQFQEQLGETGSWLLEFDDPEERRGLAVLKMFDLIEQGSKGPYSGKLTDLGKRVCLQPSLLEEALGATPGAQQAMVKTMVNNFNGPIQNAQVGDHNTQNITYNVVLQSLIEKVENDASIEPDEKSRLVGMLKDVLASGVGQAIVAGIGALAGG